MAVQAHRPSNAFVHDRNGQDGNDCSMQPQKPHFPFINDGAHTRKRVRDVSSLNGIEIAAAPMNPRPPQSSELTQLNNHPHGRQMPNVISIGLPLAPSDRHGQLQQCTGREHRFTWVPDVTGDLSGEIKRQTDELESFLKTQGEQLRRTLAGNRERHYRKLVSAAEGLVARRLREKDTEMEKATRRYAELEARAAQLAADSRVWQMRAAAREAEAASLQDRLQQAIAIRDGAYTAAEQGIGGAGLGSGRSAEEAEDAESVCMDPSRVELIGPRCRVCWRRSATVVALPCRHLGLCRECDGATGACPACLCSKNASVEAFFS